MLAGSTLPPIGAFARARWTVLLGEGRGLPTALALESLIDQAAFVVGPVLVTALAAGVDPAAGLAAAIIVVVGFFGVGVVFGLIEVAVVAITCEHGHPGAAGVMLGLRATGSLLAGIAFGAVAWRVPARRRFVAAVAAFAALIDHAGGQAALTASIAAGAVTALAALLGYRTLPAVPPVSRTRRG